MTKTEIKTKYCPKCGETKPTELFYTKHNKSRGNKPYVSTPCKKCARVYSIGWISKNRTRSKGTTLKRIYGISFEEFEKMLIEQGGVCAICGEDNKSRDLCVDHNHGTGEVRGLLCHKCNLKFAWFEKYKDRIVGYE